MTHLVIDDMEYKGATWAERGFFSLFKVLLRMRSRRRRAQRIKVWF